MTKVWYVTGSSRGLGRALVTAALARGDRVVATARDPRTLDDLVTEFGDALLPLRLDVTDRSEVTRSVRSAHEHFGRLDVVVNNAGYGLFGAVEELGEQQIRDQLETNLLGALWVTQAVLPYLRERRAGHIVQISSIGGIAAFPLLGGYHATKWALEGITDALAQEMAGFGIKVTLVEPGELDTDWAGSSAVRAEPNPAYDQLRTAAGRRAPDPADPAVATAAVLDIVDDPRPPLRVLVGPAAYPIARFVYTQRLKTWTDRHGTPVTPGGG